MADRKFPPRHGAKTIRQFCAKWRQWQRHFDAPTTLVIMLSGG